MIKKVMTGLALGLVLAGSAGAQIISQWNFEGLTATNTGVSPIATVGSLSADVGSGTASALHASASTVWSEPSGSGTAKSLSSNTWAIGDYYQFQVSTVGFTSINVAWFQNGSGTGPAQFKLQYSTDGTNFTDFANYTIPSGITWTATGGSNAATTFTQNLSAVTAINNVSAVYFRLTDTSTVSISGGAVGTGGTNRVDRFTVSQGAVDISVAAAVPEPHEYALAVAGLLGLVVVMRRRKTAQVF